jgi:hypothetical protein
MITAAEKRRAATMLTLNVFMDDSWHTVRLTGDRH